MVGSVSAAGEVPLTYKWDKEWLQDDSYMYNHGLARICGVLSYAAPIILKKYSH